MIEIDKNLTKILLMFYRSPYLEVMTNLTDLLKSFPIDRMPDGMTQANAVIEFFEKRGLHIICSTQDDKAVICTKSNRLVRESIFV